MRTQTFAPLSLRARRVVEDDAIVGAGLRAVPNRIHVLEVIQHEVRELRHREEGLPRRKTAGVDGGVEAPPTALVETFRQETGLGERLAAREGHAAAGRVEEDPVALQRVNQVADLEVATRQLASVGRTRLDARTAAGAAIAIPRLSSRRRSTLLDGAGRRARTTREAAIGADHHHRSLVDALRVVAPAAGERTALQKGRGPDARSVVHRAALDVEDPAD